MISSNVCLPGGVPGCQDHVQLGAGTVEAPGPSEPASCRPSVHISSYSLSSLQREDVGVVSYKAGHCQVENSKEPSSAQRRPPKLGELPQTGEES